MTGVRTWDDKVKEAYFFKSLTNPSLPERCKRDLASNSMADVKYIQPSSYRMCQTTVMNTWSMTVHDTQM